MRNSQDIFETRERSFISAFSVCMTIPLRNIDCVIDKETQLTSGENLKLITYFEWCPEKCPREKAPRK